MSALRTGGTAGSAWPTTSAADGERQTLYCRRKERNPTLEGASRGWEWLTPTTSDTCGCREEDGKRSGGLNTQSSEWPTPDTPNGGRTASREEVETRGTTNQGKRQIGLSMASRYWATPNAAVVNDRETPQTWIARQGRREKAFSEPLTIQVCSFQTSHSPETMRDGRMYSSAERISRPLCRLLAATWRADSRGLLRLNPNFVDWLMGWPIGWSMPESIGFGRPEMESYLSRQRLRLWSLFDARRAA